MHGLEVVDLGDGWVTLGTLFNRQVLGVPAIAFILFAGTKL